MIPMMPVQEVGFIECKKFTIARGTTTTPTTITFVLPKQASTRLWGFGITAGMFDFITFTPNSGVTNIVEIYKGSGVAHSEQAATVDSETVGKVTITNTSNAAIDICAYVFKGSIAETSS